MGVSDEIDRASVRPLGHLLFGHVLGLMFSSRSPPYGLTPRPLTIMKTKVLSTLLVSSLLSFACESTDGAGAADVRIDSTLALTGNATAGAALFGENCSLSTCHGTDGKGNGTAGNDLLAFVAQGDDRAFVSIVLNGVDGSTMTNWDEFLTDQQIADLLAYVKSLGAGSGTGGSTGTGGAGTGGATGTGGTATGGASTGGTASGGAATGGAASGGTGGGA